MANLSVIVLTKNEEANLPDLLSSVSSLKPDLFVVDSGSTDKTIDIAVAAGAKIFEHPFENYADQRNWAFDHLPIQTPWTLCLDADERLTAALASEIQKIIQSSTVSETGFMLRKRTIFMGRWLRFGGQYPAYHTRLFRTGSGRCENRLYDQHFYVNGPVGILKGDYIDILTDSLDKWIDRHNRWASMEAEELARSSNEGQVEPKFWGTPVQRKRFLRVKVYKRFPLFVRPFLLFFLDYVIRLGFLDGRPGLVFHVLQRFWFRFLVDAKLFEMSLQKLSQKKET